MSNWVLAIHGGAGALSRDEMSSAQEAEFHHALHRVLVAAGVLLASGVAALDAVERAVADLEDNPLFNAGRGSSFNREGKIEMEAAIMDGSSRKAGAATLLRRVRNPIRLARLIMDRTEHITIGGDPAETFAQAEGLSLEDEDYFFTQFRYDSMIKIRGTGTTSLSEDVIVPVESDSPEAAGTVGAVSRDRHGRLAAAISSGGTTNKRAGRIGQASIIGAGIYANDATCAVSCTGQGEAFMRGVTAYDVSALMEFRGLGVAEAAEIAVKERLPGRGGLIAVGHDGSVALPRNTEGMYRGWIGDDGVPHTAIYDDEREWPPLKL